MDWEPVVGAGPREPPWPPTQVAPHLEERSVRSREGVESCVAAATVQSPVGGRETACSSRPCRVSAVENGGSVPAQRMVMGTATAADAAEGAAATGAAASSSPSAAEAPSWQSARSMMLVFSPVEGGGAEGDGHKGGAYRKGAWSQCRRQRRGHAGEDP